MLIAYLYDINNNVAAQYTKISNFQCRKVLNDIGTASFSLDLKDEGVKTSLLKEFSRVKITKLISGSTDTVISTVYTIWRDDENVWNDSNTWAETSTIQEKRKINADVEKTVFDGVLREISATSKGISLTVNDFLYLFKKKKNYTDKSYNSVPVNTILSGILGEINARYNSGITLSTTETDTISKEYKANISFYDILRDLANSGYEYDIVDQVLIFKKTIGRDRTVDPDFVEFRSEVANPVEINISDYSLSRDAENLANAVTGISDITNLQIDTDSIAKYGRIEEVYTVDGDVANATTKLLADHKDSVTEVSVTPLTNDFFLADLGDIVKVYIDGGNDIQFFDGSLKVIEKSMTFGVSETVDIKLSTTKVATPTLLDTLRDLRDRVKKLEV